MSTQRPSSRREASSIWASVPTSVRSSPPPTSGPREISTTPNSRVPAKQSSTRARYRDSKTCKGRTPLGKRTVCNGNIASRSVTSPTVSLSHAAQLQTAGRGRSRPAGRLRIVISISSGTRPAHVGCLVEGPSSSADFGPTLGLIPLAGLRRRPAVSRRICGGQRPGGSPSSGEPVDGINKLLSHRGPGVSPVPSPLSSRGLTMPRGSRWVFRSRRLRCSRCRSPHPTRTRRASSRARRRGSEPRSPDSSPPAVSA